MNDWLDGPYRARAHARTHAFVVWALSAFQNFETNTHVQVQMLPPAVRRRQRTAALSVSHSHSRGAPSDPICAHCCSQEDQNIPASSRDDMRRYTIEKKKQLIKLAQSQQHVSPDDILAALRNERATIDKLGRALSECRTSLNTYPMRYYTCIAHPTTHNCVLSYPATAPAPASSTHPAQQQLRSSAGASMVWSANHLHH